MTAGTSRVARQRVAETFVPVQPRRAAATAVAGEARIGYARHVVAAAVDRPTITAEFPVKLALAIVAELPLV